MFAYFFFSLSPNLMQEEKIYLSHPIKTFTKRLWQMRSEIRNLWISVIQREWGSKHRWKSCFMRFKFKCTVACQINFDIIVWHRAVLTANIAKKWKSAVSHKKIHLNSLVCLCWINKKKTFLRVWSMTVTSFLLSGWISKNTHKVDTFPSQW